MSRSADHDCAHRRAIYGVCTICAAAPPEPTLALGEVVCVFGCGEPVDPSSPRTWQQQTGWTRPRQQGGTNALALRQPIPGRYAHSECIDAARAGRLAQPALPLADPTDPAKVP